jgi:hypothetical protein
MPITLTVNNQPFQYPVSGDSPGWGEGATDWATEVTLVLNSLLGPNDIIQSTIAVINNQVSAMNVVGLALNTGQVRSAIIEYSVYRTSTANPSGNSESGTMIATYDNLAASGMKWSLIITDINGYSGINFSILDNGQVQYTTNDINSVGYSGNMHFRARALNQ